MNSQITQLNIPEGMIDLGVGIPDPALLPLSALAQASGHRLDHDDPSILQYGKEQGNGYFRRSLSGFLSTSYQSFVDPENLFITSGATSGIDLFCACFTKPGDTVIVEEPTYFLALRLFADRRLNIVGLPTDAGGIDMDALEKRVSKSPPAFVYIVPAFHNPSGTTLTAERRKRLHQLSHKYNFFVLADEVYHMLSYTLIPPAPMGSFSMRSKIISVGSFAKILAPGLRLGWIQADSKNIKQLTHMALLQSGGGMNPFTSAIVQSMIELDLLQKHIDRLVNIYKRRAVDLSKAVDQYLPESTAFKAPCGGFFLWVRLPEGMDAKKLRRRSVPHQVNFQPGYKFSASGKFRNFMRLCFVHYNSDKLQEGVRRLGKVMLQ
jgi:DNA-binding transcriptional MocR family regulator